MYSYISLLLFIIPSIAEENLFLNNEPSTSDSDGEVLLSSNSIPLNVFNSIDSNPTNENNIFTTDSSGPDKDLYAVVNQADDDMYLNLALDDCSLSIPAVNKNRVKTRDDVCNVKSPAVFLPDDFRDLATSAQDKIFNEFMCPSSDSRFKVAYLPVCSSRIPENTRIAQNFLERVAVNGEGLTYYLLHDSFLCTYSSDSFWRHHICKP